MDLNNFLKIILFENRGKGRSREREGGGGKEGKREGGREGGRGLGGEGEKKKKCK